jgi:cytochrome c-type biogenesis protein CcmH
MRTPGDFLPLCERKAPGRRLLVVALALLAVAAPAAAAPPQASLPDVEDEVMCPICGTLLELSQSPQAERQRAFISRRIAAGRSKEEIKEALVAEYGRPVLALPSGSGFDLSAYLVPAIAFVLAVGALAIGVVRWRRAGERTPTQRPGAGDAPREADEQRLEDDLARYDL